MILYFREKINYEEAYLRWLNFSALFAQQTRNNIFQPRNLFLIHKLILFRKGIISLAQYRAISKTASKGHWIYTPAHILCFFELRLRKSKLWRCGVKPMLNALLRNMGINYSTLFKYRQSEGQIYFLQQVLWESATVPVPPNSHKAFHQTRVDKLSSHVIPP